MKIELHVEMHFYLLLKKTKIKHQTININYNMKATQIITHFTDNDLYTFTCQYYILKTYPTAEVSYNFFDRNKTKYVHGFANLLREQVNYMKDLVITDEEIDFMKKKLYYLPSWYFTFLKGYRFNPDEVVIKQDDEGFLYVTITGKWYSAIMWEMPILSCISELLHSLNGDKAKYDIQYEYANSFKKMYGAIKHGLYISDMGTRRRFSFEHQRNVIKACVEAQRIALRNLECKGKFVGTSNVWFAKEFDLTPIGTMSHQIVSFEENVSGVYECNNQTMNKWSECFDGLNGIYLYDCFGDKVFFNNFRTKYAKTFDGLRVDSGKEEEQVDKIVNKYKELGIDPLTKTVVFSNGLNIERCKEIFDYCQNKIKCSFGIGTHLTCDIAYCKPSNIVIKLVKGRITDKREWHDCIKLSCDKGKMLGNLDKCNFIKSIIED